MVGKRKRFLCAPWFIIHLDTNLSRGFHIVSRVALNISVITVVFPVYRIVSALLLLGPFTYFIEKNERPPLTFSLLLQFFFLAFVGHVLRVANICLCYAKLCSAFIFVMASAFGLEKVNFVRRDGLAKVLGTIASIGGATVITLYKGPPLLHQGLQGNPIEEETMFLGIKAQNWTWGLYLFAWTLIVLGWLDDSSGSGGEKVLGETVPYIVYMFLYVICALRPLA